MQSNKKRTFASRYLPALAALPLAVAAGSVSAESLEQRVQRIRLGDPQQEETNFGPLVSFAHMNNVLDYIAKGKAAGARVLCGGERVAEGEYAKGAFVAPTIFSDCSDDMTIVREEIFGPVVSVTTFKDEEEALAIANDTLYGLGAGVWSRNANTCYRFGRGIQAGRVWTNCYHAYPAHAAFGGYKQSGVGRETHKMMLDHYQQTKNMLVSYSPKKLGFF